METNIRVAHVTTIDQSLRYLLLDQINYLQLAGYEIAGVSANGSDVTTLTDAGIKHYSISISRNISPLSDMYSLWKLYRLFRQERFTIVHTHTPKPGLLGQIAARLAGVPVIVNTLHGLYFHENTSPLQYRLFVFLEKVAARCSDVILSQSQEDIDTVLKLNICNQNKIKYLGNGINLETFDARHFTEHDIANYRERFSIPKDGFVVGFVGRLAGRRKGFLDFLRAGKIIADVFPDTRFLIVGAADSGKEDAVEPEIAHQYGIAGKCIFLGHCPNSDLPTYYSLMDVLVLPSLFEGVPRAVMEASAMSVPAVVTDVKGNREAVDNQQNGLLVPLGNVEALAEAVIHLLSNTEERKRMGENGRSIAEERFDEQIVFAKVKTEYERLLQEKCIDIPESISNV